MQMLSADAPAPTSVREHPFRLGSEEQASKAMRALNTHCFAPEGWIF